MLKDENLEYERAERWELKMNENLNMINYIILEMDETFENARMKDNFSRNVDVEQGWAMSKETVSSYEMKEWDDLKWEQSIWIWFGNIRACFRIIRLSLSETLYLIHFLVDISLLWAWIQNLKQLLIP